MPSAASSTYRNSREAVPVPQASMWVAPESRASTHFLISAGMTCELRRVEVVARAVQIDRHQVDRIEAVLLPVGLRLHQQHLLGQAVRRVGLLRVAVPQVVLAERHRRELRDRRRPCPTATNFSTPASRACSISWMPMIALS